MHAAATLMAERGVAGTSLDDVRAVTDSSKSQLYHYFGDKRGLVQAVIEYQSAVVLDAQATALGAVHDWDDLDQWATMLVEATERTNARGGCPIGTLAAGLADTDEAFRLALSDSLETWLGEIKRALTQLQTHGLIDADADLDMLTTMTLATLQGGLLLAKTSRDSSRLRAALAGALALLHANGRTPAT